MVARQPHEKHLAERTRLQKNAQIRKTMAATKARRKSMVVQVREISITNNRLTRRQKEDLARLFLEAKWVRNTALDLGVFNSAQHREVVNQLRVKLPSGELEQRTLTTIGGQQVQSVIAELNANRKSLAALKRNGRRTGRLKFAPRVVSLNLAQHGSTHKIDRSANRVKVANITGWLPVRGLHQLDAVDEIANAKLVSRPSGYFLLVTTYTHPERAVGRATQTPDAQGTAVGIDMGVSTHLTLSSGQKLDVLFEETDRLRRLRRKLQRQTKGSANYRKTKRLIRVESEKITRRKDEAAIKVVREILRNERVYIQDENLKSWKTRSGFVRGGKRVHSSILGRVKTMLSGHERVFVLDRWQATTATCVCGVVTPHELSERIFVCRSCGYTADRDLHAAENMIRLGEAKLSPRQELTRTPVEIGVRHAAAMDFSFIPGVRSWSVNQEAATSSGSP